jgi:hypothetical protein
VPCRSPRSAVRSSSVRELGPSPVWHGPVPSAPNTPRPTVGLTGPPHLVGGVSSWQHSPCSCCDRAFWAILTRQIVSRGIVRGALLGIGFVLCTIGMQTTSVLISAFVTGTTVVYCAPGRPRAVRRLRPARRSKVGTRPTRPERRRVDGRIQPGRHHAGLCAGESANASS